LSRYILFGQRKGLRRRIDQEKGSYVDRYSSGLFLILVLIIGLNVLDALITMMILELGGRELSPIVQSVMDLCSAFGLIRKEKEPLKELRRDP